MGCVYSRSCIGETCSPKDPKVKDNQNKKAAEIAVFSSDNSDEESGDQISHLGGIGDTEVGITRLSRVSSQFLPPEGSRKVNIPSGDYELRYSYLSQRGYYPDALDKANQDSFCIHSPFGTNPNDHFFGVFDGHGEYGAECSQFVKKKLCENLLRSSRYHIDAVEACNSAFLTTNLQLHADNLDDSMSGTTAITILVRGKTLHVANSGDSRAIIAEKRGKDLVAVDLSIDHTPFRVDELERVKLCGARVLTLDQIEGLKNPDVQCWGTEEADDGDPPRLWVENGMYPGTAFTRSLGDSIAETIGVVANPEIVALELTQNHPFFVIASDGVFEFLTSQAVVDMVAKYKDPRDACAAIVAESYRLWLQYETRTDDITVIVVHVNGLTYGQTGNIAASPGSILKSPIPQVVEATGSEPPSPMNWSRMNHARNDLSRARLRVLESSLNNGQIWVPPSPSHRKTWEEEAHIQRVLHDHFLFRKLTDSQSHVLLDCMERVEIQPGEIVVQQGGEGDCFYVVGYGELEVLATQEEKDGEVPRVLQRYTAEKLSSFGELALMYNKPLQASVRAVTSVTLWVLRREDFRGILMSKFTNLPSLQLLRSVDLLSSLTILQLSQISDCLSEVSFSNGQPITNRDTCLLGLYTIQKGRVLIKFDAEVLDKPNTGSLVIDNPKEGNYMQIEKEVLVEKSEGSYFGEWMLLGEQIRLISAVAVGDVVCAVLSKEKFDAVVGPLTMLQQKDHQPKEYSVSFSMEPKGVVDSLTFGKVKLSELDWKKSLYSTECCEMGLVHLKDTDNLLTLKRFSKHKVRSLGKEASVIREKNLMKSLCPSVFVPRILCTCVDQTYAGILLNTLIACPIKSILHKPLDEVSAKFCAASLVVTLEDLHKEGILYRGVTPDVMLDQTGHIQLVDFQFGKKISGERTFTICGSVDFLAPEMVHGNGHGFPADWWALGVLIHLMLLGERPFGSWRENELDTFAKIAKGRLYLPQTLSREALDLITKLLEVEENTRLGTNGAESVQAHPWFSEVDWKGIRDRSSPVPSEILYRVAQHLECSDESGVSQLSPPRKIEELDSPEWLEDW